VKKHIQLVQCICCIMVFFFVCGALVPACSAQISTPQANGEKTSLESPVKKVKHADDDEDFFTFAIIWGTFEERFVFSFFGNIWVYNRDPWCNRTMNVIGYRSSLHQWFVKKSWYVQCNFLHVGIVGRNWLCVIGIRDIEAF